MSSIVERVKESLGFGGNENDIGCRAIVDAETGEVCGAKVWGRGFVDGHEIRYCKTNSHVPSNATPWNSGRWESLDFYVPEDDVVIEVE